MHINILLTTHLYFEFFPIVIYPIAAYIWMPLILYIIHRVNKDITKEILSDCINIYALTHLIVVPLIRETTTRKICDPNKVSGELECIKMPTESFNQYNCTNTLVDTSLIIIGFGAGLLTIALYLMRNNPNRLKYILSIFFCICMLTLWTICLMKSVIDVEPCMYSPSLIGLCQFGIINSYFIMFLITYKGFLYPCDDFKSAIQL